MKKIILAAAAATAILFTTGIAEARVHSRNTQYSNNTEGTSILDEIFGTPSWSVTPQPRFRNLRQARAYYKHQENTYFSSAAPTFSSHSIVALGYHLQGQGFRVSEHPVFGGVHHVHAHHSAHYSGRAIDVNVGAGIVEAYSRYAHRFDALAANLRSNGYKVLWRVPGHYNHIHVQI